MAAVWCVKVTCLPKGVTSDELARKFGISPDSADVPRGQSGPNYYAYVNGFTDKQLAEDFVRKWNNERLRSGTIKCKVAPLKSHAPPNRPPSLPRSNANRSRSVGQTSEYKRILASMTSNRNHDNDTSDEENTDLGITRTSRSDQVIVTRTTSASRGRFNSCSRDDSCSSRTGLCRNGIECFNLACRFDHPSEWYVCEDGIDCEQFDCQGKHPYVRTKPCYQADQCQNMACKFLHPLTRTGECDIGDQCREWNCKALHSQDRPKICFYKEQCYNTTCLRLHPPNRQLCPYGVECDNISCRSNHPPGRAMPCPQGSACGNFYCMNLHPEDWDPCDIGSECVNLNCPHSSHPSDRLVRQITNPKNSLQSRRVLKSKQQRSLDREKEPLPVLGSRDEFCRRLKEDRLLVVIAETGSGKSTQLPQYAAEDFGGLVVSTQPRVIAAISLARRVANEYDGTSVGESVGYQVGRESNRVPGKDILFMTDSALIQESQKDPLLSRIKVLLVDEAHERSLNTDIVIGLAKLLLRKRSDDFYVVIASATIHPKKFLDFFNRTDTSILEVRGRPYDVTLEHLTKAADSNEDDISFTVSTTLQLYKKHLAGHVLVFLPGQREIEQALVHFNRDIPDSCVALPLYGSLSTEEQDRVLQFDQGPKQDRRMVVFCTNVAETSLTIKNTRLVVDSGWAKEARFDPKRRLTVIEMVRISKSSANQRKGRAGRTESGHCVRLYNENELIRDNIEPEISRSSLDLVVLQLLRLRLDPNTFPFIDPPEATVLQKSLALLTDLECITRTQDITLKGELFTELGLDPRLSAFVVSTYMKHGPVLELTATIVAILTAPGSLFFMGGSTKEQKQEARGRVAVGAQKHDSDLLYAVSVYKTWQNVGIIDQKTRKCGTCQTSTKRGDSCRSCRVKHSMTHTLNNKILNNIEMASNTMMKIIQNKRWQIDPGFLLKADENDIIGAYLLKNFPEHHGHLLVPHLPNEGVYMVANDLRARITRTSVFVQRHVKSIHFIAMSITKLATGDFMIERLHPLNVPSSISSKVIEEVAQISNVGWEWNSEIRKQISQLSKESWSTWLVYEHNLQLCETTVWGEAKTKDAVVTALTPVVNDTLHSLLNRTHSWDCGIIRGTFESGLVCLKIENIDQSNDGKYRLDLQHISSKSFEELDQWLNESLGVHLKDIQENNFQPQKQSLPSDNRNYEAPPFFITFKYEETFRNALAKVSLFHLSPRRSDASNVLHMSEKNSWGRQLLLTLQNVRFYTERDLQQQLDKHMVSCKQTGKRFLPGLQLNNLPANISEVHIRSALGRDLVCSRVDIFHSDKDDPTIGSVSARVLFENQQQRQDAYRRLRSTYLLQPHTIAIFSKKSRQYMNIRAEPTIETLRIEPQTFLCTAKSRKIAMDFYSKSHPQHKVDSSASVTVTHSELYPAFDRILQDLCNRFQVKVEKLLLPEKKTYSKAVRCIFTAGNPAKTAMAASLLIQSMSPILIKLIDDRQKSLFKELFEENLIQKWTKDLRLSCETKDQYRSVIEIHGSQIEQGQLMRLIADYSDTFDHRYRALPDLSPEAIGYFGRHKAADIQLQEINSKWTTEGCTVTFLRKTSTIIVYGQPRISPEKIDACEKEVKDFLATFVSQSSADENTTEQHDVARRCAFCQRQMAATRTFRICGHPYCRCAPSQLNQIPMKCPTCQHRIHIQDIKEIFSNNFAALTKLCRKSMEDHLSNSTDSKDNDQLFCPNDQCDGLILRSQGYQTCLTCGQRVCGKCRVIDDDLHEDRTCDERNGVEKKLGQFVPRLFEEAKTFIGNNWPRELPPILRFENNTFLEQLSCESLRRFYKGVENAGESPPPDFTRGFFAFHGTSVNAIEPICQSGFDSTRRRGQVYGPGEYFGVTAAISHGYSKTYSSLENIRMMLITYILRCDRVSTKEGFCYVVNNPVDCSYAFNLPVAVVIYGEGSAKTLSSPFPIGNVTSNTTERSDTCSAWKSPFRWYWCQNNQNFEAYNDKINSELEQLYEQWKLKLGPSKVITSPLIRYVDDMPQTYFIDFEKKLQMNTKTSFVRRIQRRALDPSKVNTSNNWRFRDEHNQWTPYESLVQQKIEDAYQSYRSEKGPSTLQVRFPGRPETYQIDFVTGRQVNMTSSEVRLVTRE